MTLTEGGEVEREKVDMDVAGENTYLSITHYDLGNGQGDVDVIMVHAPHTDTTLFRNIMQWIVLCCVCAGIIMICLHFLLCLSQRASCGKKGLRDTIEYRI
jgi:hypothetical protein